MSNSKWIKKPAPTPEDIAAAALVAPANESPLTEESEDERRQREAEEQREEEISKILSRLKKQSKPLGSAEDYRKTPEKRPMLLVYDPTDDPTHTDPIDFLPQGKVGFFVAPGGTGKTQALVQLAVAVASGYRWLDTFYSPKGPARVLLALGEEDRDEFRRRINPLVDAMYRDIEKKNDGRRLAGKLLAHLQANLTELPLDGIKSRLIGPKSPKSGECPETPFFDALCRYVGLTLDEQGEPKPTPGFEGFSLIILDPASRFMGPDCETDNAAATSFIQCVEVLTRAPNAPTVILAHHTGKLRSSGRSGQDAGRGASALTDGARWSAQLARKMDGNGKATEHIELTLDKTNYTPRLKTPLILQFSEDRKNPRLELVDSEEELEGKPKTRRRRRATDAEKQKQKTSPEEPDFDAE